MPREATYYGRMKAADVLNLPFYGVSSCAVTLMRVDNATSTGDIYALNVIPKVYAWDSQTYDAMLSGGAGAIYGFPIATPEPSDPLYFFNVSTVTTLKEIISGRTLALSGAGTPAPSSLPLARLAGKNYMITPTCQATDVGTTIISPRENAGLPWTIETWIYRAANTAAGQLLLETNAAVTNFFQLLINAAGTFTLTKNGVGVWTSTAAAVPVFVWTHVVLVYTGSQLILYLNNVASAAVAYTHQTGLTTDRTVLNFGAGGMHYMANMALYPYAVTAAYVNKRYAEIAGADFYSGNVIDTGFVLGQGGTFSVVFSNNQVPFSQYPATNPIGGALPLQGIGQIRINEGEYIYEIHTEEADV